MISKYSSKTLSENWDEPGLCDPEDVRVGGTQNLLQLMLSGKVPWEAIFKQVKG